MDTTHNPANNPANSPTSNSPTSHNPNSSTSVIPDVEYGGSIVPFTWDVPSRTAALCLAGVLLSPRDRTMTRIAQLIGVSTSVLATWRRHPEFAAVVDAYRTRASDAIMRTGIADKTARVSAMLMRHDLLTEIIEARQQWAQDNVVDGALWNTTDEEEGVSHVPGIETGLINTKHRTVGSGALQQVVIEGFIDTQLLAEMRHLERAIAEEKGERHPESSVNLDLKLYAGVDLSRI